MWTVGPAKVALADVSVGLDRCASHQWSKTFRRNIFLVRHASHSATKP